jgi:hypothetical protein
VAGRAVIEGHDQGKSVYGEVIAEVVEAVPRTSMGVRPRGVHRKAYGVVSRDATAVRASLCRHRGDHDEVVISYTFSTWECR